MEASATKVARVSAWFSKSLASGRLPVAPEPREGAHDYSAARQDNEALHVVVPLDDLQPQPWHLGYHSVNLPSVVVAIGPDQFEPRVPPVYLVESQTGPPRSSIAAEWTTTRIGSPWVRLFIVAADGIVTVLSFRHISNYVLTELAERLGVKPSSLSFHLAQLTDAGIITQRRLSRQLIYSAEYGAMNDLLAYLTENCCGRGGAHVPACDAAAILATGDR
jgi:DNA-binding transcriptional ArsR family regulator